MTTQALVSEIIKKQSFLCIGLDVDMSKIPTHLLELDDRIFEFNKAIIDATHHLCVAYKPNTAFYEAYGLKGWKSLQKTMAYLNTNYPEIFTIADAKRGDIGNTSTKLGIFQGEKLSDIIVVETTKLIKDPNSILSKIKEENGPLSYCSVVPKDVVEFYGEKFRSNPIGTGPFKFKRWEENIKLVFKTNKVSIFQKEARPRNTHKFYEKAKSISFLKRQKKRWR